MAQNTHIGVPYPATDTHMGVAITPEAADENTYQTFFFFEKSVFADDLTHLRGRKGQSA